MSGEISYPFGAADVQAPAYAATLNLEATNQKTIVNVAQLTGAVTINVTATELKVGAELIIKLESDGTARDATLGTGFTGTTVAGVINKTKYATFVYDGTTFVHIGTQQVD